MLALALTIAVWCFKLLKTQHWFLGWLRGTAGMLMIFAVVALALMVFDVFSYKQLAREQFIATISFNEIGPQRFSATFVETNGNQNVYELLGDQWQLDSRIIKWNGVVNRVGLTSGYRLDSISGRYLSLTDEQTKERSVYPIRKSKVIDVWNWLHKLEKGSFIDARYGNSTFLPMVDGGQYQISVSSSGILARPLNEPAKVAVERWQ